MSLTYRFVDPSTVLQAPEGDLVFESSWDNGTGTGLTARTDGGKWTADGANSDIAVVAGGAGCPTDNCLQVSNNAGDFAETWSNYTADIGQSIAVGQRITWRWYMNWISADDGWVSDHGIAWRGAQEFPTNGGTPWFTQNHTATDMVVGYDVPTEDANNIDYVWRSNGSVPKNQWHRYEVQFEQLTSTTYIMRMTVWDTDDSTILFGPGDFESLFSSEVGDSFVFDGNHQEDFETFTGFTGGIDAGTIDEDEVTAQYAAVAVVFGDLVGPYNASRGW